MISEVFNPQGALLPDWTETEFLGVSILGWLGVTSVVFFGLVINRLTRLMLRRYLGKWTDERETIREDFEEAAAPPFGLAAMAADESIDRDPVGISPEQANSRGPPLTSGA